MPRTATAKRVEVIEPVYIHCVDLIDDESLEVVSQVTLDAIVASLRPAQGPRVDMLRRAEFVVQAQLIVEERMRAWNKAKKRYAKAIANYELCVLTHQPFDGSTIGIILEHYDAKIEMQETYERADRAQEFLAGLLFRQKEFCIA